jgi:tubulin alpha
MLVNSDSCRWLLDRQHRKYDRLWEKRSFVHWYVGEGIDDDAVTYGRAETASLEKDY